MKKMNTTRKCRDLITERKRSKRKIRDKKGQDERNQSHKICDSCQL